MQNQAIDIHHHYVPKQLIEETKHHGKALGGNTSGDRGGHALSFAGSKPHRLQPALMDVDRRRNTRFDAYRATWGDNQKPSNVRAER